MKPLVLFSIEKWLDVQRPELGNHPHECGIVGSLASSGMGTVALFHYDYFYQQNPEGNADERLVESCRALRPALLLQTHVIAHGDRNIKPATLSYIRDEMKIPVAMVWFESAPDVVRCADRFVPSVSLTVFTDTKEYWKQFTAYPERCAGLYGPIDTALFNADDAQQRDLPLTFIGTTFGRPDRALSLAMLWGSGVYYLKAGGVNEGPSLRPDEYAQLLRRSLVTINFTSAVTFNHVNARVAEATLCGAMLLQTEDAETPNVLEPFLDYIPFKESFRLDGGSVSVLEGDLVQKAVEYAYQNRKAAARVADSGRRRAMEKLDGREFWSEIFLRVGI